MYNSFELITNDTVNRYQSDTTKCINFLKNTKDITGGQ